jgi:hypothetical protein
MLAESQLVRNKGVVGLDSQTGGRVEGCHGGPKNKFGPS